MSRSDYAQTLSFDKSRAYAAVSCIIFLALGAGCRFSTNPGDSVIVADAGARDVSDEDQATPTTTRTSTGTKAASTLDASVATDADEEPNDSADAATSDAGEPAAAPTGSSPAAGSSAPVQSTAGTSAPAPAQPTASAGTSAPALPTAGTSAPATSPPPAAGNFATPTQTPKEAECSADLANCLLRDPLAYAECLRANQDNGCPDPDAGIPTTTSPVTTEDGKPLSQACQAELANCIARLPTPENAASCMEKARTCK